MIPLGRLKTCICGFDPGLVRLGDNKFQVICSCGNETLIEETNNMACKMWNFGWWCGKDPRTVENKIPSRRVFMDSNYYGGYYDREDAYDFGYEQPW